MPTRENYLAHYGVKGQKWGIRRYQNPDGSLTELGRKHYGYESYRKTPIGGAYNYIHKNEKYLLDSAKKAITPRTPDDQRSLKQRTLFDKYYNKDGSLTKEGLKWKGYDENGDYKAWRERRSSVVNDVTGGNYLNDIGKKNWWKAQNYYFSLGNPFSFVNVKEDNPNWRKTVMGNAAAQAAINTVAGITVAGLITYVALNPLAAKASINKIGAIALTKLGLDATFAGTNAAKSIVDNNIEKAKYEANVPGNYSSESQRVAQEQLKQLSKLTSKSNDTGRMSEIVNNYSKNLGSSEAKALKEEFVRQNWNNMQADPLALNNMRTTITEMDDYGWEGFSKAAGRASTAAKIKQNAKDASYKASLMGTVVSNVAARNRGKNELINELQKSYNAQNQPVVKEYKAKGEELINKYIKENEELKARVEKLEQDKEKDKKK